MYSLPRHRKHQILIITALNENCNKKEPNDDSLGSLCWHLLIFPGSCPPSIFSASELNFCVRNGNRWTLTAINTNYGASSRTRTYDNSVNSRVLYRLSYRGIFGTCNTYLKIDQLYSFLINLVFFTLLYSFFQINIT